MEQNDPKSLVFCNTEVFAHTKKNWKSVRDSSPCDKTENFETQSHNRQCARASGKSSNPTVADFVTSFPVQRTAKTSTTDVPGPTPANPQDAAIIGALQDLQGGFGIEVKAALGRALTIPDNQQSNAANR